MSAHSCTRYNRCDLSPEEVQAVRDVRGIVYALCAADLLF